MYKLYNSLLKNQDKLTKKPSFFVQTIQKKYKVPNVLCIKLMLAYVLSTDCGEKKAS